MTKQKIKEGTRILSEIELIEKMLESNQFLIEGICYNDFSRLGSRVHKYLKCAFEEELNDLKIEFEGL